MGEILTQAMIIAVTHVCHGDVNKNVTFPPYLYIQ